MSLSPFSRPPPLLFRPEYEQVEDDEAEAIADLEALFLDMARTGAEHEGHAARAVHAKGQALLEGRLEVDAGLPAELAQGLFHTPAESKVLVRFSSPPAEQLPDSVSTPRVQPCTDLRKMPKEDAAVEWDAEMSPYLAGATLTVGPQMAWTGAKSVQRKDALAFAPWHALAAHRPLGAINPARRGERAASRQFRSSFNRCLIHEPLG